MGLKSALTLAACGAMLLTAAASAQPGAPQMTPPQMVAAQQAAMAKLSALNGVWRGPSSMTDSPGGPVRQMVETARVGPFLDGAYTVIERRGYLAAGGLGFHAFNIVSFDPGTGQYHMQARAAGRSGDFSFRLTPDGYIWEIGPTGRGLRYTATIKNGHWDEVGEAVSPDKPPVKMSEFHMIRVGSTDWPEAGAIPPK